MAPKIFIKFSTQGFGCDKSIKLEFIFAKKNIGQSLFSLHFLIYHL